MVCSDASDGLFKLLIAENEGNTIKGAISIKGFAQASEASEIFYLAPKLRDALT